MLSALIPSRHSYPAMLLAKQQVHQRSVQLGPLVLESDPLKFLTPTVDRDRTVSRRSEPSSRATLMGEQPNPWDLLQPQDVTSRHRGAKPPRRCELLGEISLLSPEYLLSFERWPLPCGTTGSLCSTFVPDRLVGLSVKLPYAHYTLHTIANRVEGTFRSLRYSFGGDHPSQTTHHALFVVTDVRLQINKGWYFNNDSTERLATPQSYVSHLSYTLFIQSQYEAIVKVSRGLFVPQRVTGIFTDTTISPSSWPRQCPDRCTIRAGRNFTRQGISLP